MFGYIYFGRYYLKCVSPGQCGEGFSSGYIAAGILLALYYVSAFYIFSEVILCLALKRKTNSEIE
jgi:hypothetical protein